MIYVAIFQSFMLLHADKSHAAWSGMKRHERESDDLGRDGQGHISLTSQNGAPAAEGMGIQITPQGASHSVCGFASDIASSFAKEFEHPTANL